MWCPLAPTPGHTVPTAQEGGAGPQSPPSPQGFLLLEKQWWAEPSAATSQRPFLSREPQGRVAVLAGVGRGPRGRGLLPTRSGLSNFGAEAGTPSRPPSQDQGPGAEVHCSRDVPLRPPSKDQQTLLEGSHPAAGRAGRRQVRTQETVWGISRRSRMSSDGKDLPESRSKVVVCDPNATQPRIWGEFTSHASQPWTPSSVVRAF